MVPATATTAAAPCMEVRLPCSAGLLPAYEVVRDVTCWDAVVSLQAMWFHCAAAVAGLLCLCACCGAVICGGGLGGRAL